MRRRDAIAAGLAALLPAARPAAAAKPLDSPLAKFLKTDPAKPVTGLSMTAGDGSALDLSAYLGRLVVLNLWGSWCFPCRDEMPGLSRLQALVAGQPISVLPLAIERKGAEAVTRFFGENGIANLPVLLGDGANVAAVFAAWGLPFTVLIDRDGREFGRVTGPARWDDPAAVAWLAGAARA